MTPTLLILSAAFLALSAADLILSLRLQKLGAVENNPLLGNHPSPRKLVTFATVSTGLWLGAALWLASEGAPGVPAVLLLGCVLRAIVVARGLKLKRELGR